MKSAEPVIPPTPVARPLAPRAAPAPWRAVLAGLCATFLGVGLARFAYGPMLPAIIGAHWFGAGEATYLGAANLAGYLGGALMVAPLSRRFEPRLLLRATMLVTAVALAACAWPANFGWFFFWRLVSGIGGGVLMVLAAPTVLPHVPANRRGVASGLIFTGIGLGIAASGTVLPLLLALGVSQAWLGLAALAGVLTLVAWGGWPTGHPAPPVAPAVASVEAVVPPAVPPSSPDADRPLLRSLRSLYLQYALNAVALVPHMVFLVDYVARGLGEGLAVGSHYWIVFGLGAAVGPVLFGHVGDRIGFGNALRAGYVVQALAIAIPAAGIFGVGGLVVSSLVVGAFTPGFAPLALGRVQELLVHRPALVRVAWSRAMTSFALLQAIAAYAMSWLLVRSGGNYVLLFWLGTAAIAMSLVVDLAVGRARRTAREALA